VAAIEKVWLLLKSYLFFVLLRLRGIDCINPIRLRGLAPRIRNAGTMRIGPDVRIYGRVTRVQLSTSPGGRLELGRDVGINEGVAIHAVSEIIIGERVMIADYTSIQDSDFHPLTPSEPTRTRPVRIERNAWLGRNVIVLSGVTIGQNAVVAAGSVVTRDVPANTLVGGNPARFIRELDIPDAEHYVRW
jgi:acetyltransferase-like isoleucine patch superfamily enzyme